LTTQGRAWTNGHKLNFKIQSQNIRPVFGQWARDKWSLSTPEAAKLKVKGPFSQRARTWHPLVQGPWSSELCENRSGVVVPAYWGPIKPVRLP